MNKFKVGDMVYSKNNDAALYCVFRILPDSSIGVIVTNGFIYVGDYEDILFKARSTKKRKKFFLKLFKKMLFKQGTEAAQEFDNLDYIEVTNVLKHGQKRSQR